MELYVGLPNEMRTLISNRGVLVRIANNSEDPFKNSPSPYLLSPGMGMNINVARNFYQQFNHWPYSYSECNVDESGELLHSIDDPSIYNIIRTTNYTYAQDTCIRYCSQQFIFKNCNCCLPAFDAIIDRCDLCVSSDQLECSINYYLEVIHVGDFIANNCLEKCPLECNKYRFNYYQSFYSYPDKHHLDQYLRNNPTLLRKYPNQTDFTDYLASNVIKVSIFYDSLSYAEILEEALMTWDSLLGILGGHLHLFLGMSFLSIVEIFELIAYVLFHKCCKSNKVFELEK